MNLIDRFLNRLTMYRVVMYGLAVIAANALLLSVLGRFSYAPLSLVGSLIVLLIVGCLIHALFRRLFNAPANLESTIITMMILFFVLAPGATPKEFLGLAIAALVAVASKYLLVWRNIHVFNPVAISAVIVGSTFVAPAFWWVGTLWLLPVTLIVSFLIARKVHRFDLYFSVIGFSVLTVAILAVFRDLALLDQLKQHFVSWPILFFAGIMVTEPLTTPPQRYQRVLYGAFIGICSSIPLHIGPVYSTPELVLVLANAGSFFVGLRQRLVLTLVEKRNLASEVQEWVFSSEHPVMYKPGQYLEWTLPHPSPDTRGIKRYFTIASAPTEKHLKLGVKVPKEKSTFKQALCELKLGETLYASQLAGDFLLPRDSSKKLVFVAGGIGVTPFRSMIQSLVDKRQSRDITLFYLAKSEDEYAYKDLFEEAASLGVKVIYQQERLTPKLLEDQLGKMSAYTYYLSGPPSMVSAYEQLLQSCGVARRNMKTDYFPGFA